MRLIDADALPRCFQPDCNGNQQFVDIKDIDAAPTIECEKCVNLGADGVWRSNACHRCYGFSRFERRQP